MKKLSILFTLLVLALLPALAEEKPVASFEEEVWDFGVIQEKDGPVSHEFKLTNTGNANLLIFEVTSQCGCTRPEYTKKPMAPGAKGKVKVTYNPSGRPGAFTKVLTVTTNGNPKKTRLKITGTVVPKGKK